MTDQTKSKLIYWVLGIFTGTAVAAPVAAFVTKKICDNDAEKRIAIAEEQGMKGMADYLIQENPEILDKEEPKPEEKPDDNKKDEYIPEEEDINNMDVSIEDEEAMINSRERTVETERYLDLTDKYNGNNYTVPYIIDEDRYNTEQWNEKVLINWYEVDNVFEDDLRVVADPYYEFGVTNGADLFKHEDLRDDPDTVYVRNDNVSKDYEITRKHRSYASTVGGEQNLGETTA